MTRTFFGVEPERPARSRSRVGNGVCVDAQTVSLAVLELGHRGVRLHRRVRDVPLLVRLLEERAAAVARRRRRRPSSPSPPASARLAEELVEDPSWSAPGCGVVHSALTRPSAFAAASGSACSTATRPSSLTTVTPGSLRGGGGVDLRERRAVRRRAEDLRVEHAGQADVAGVLGPAGHLVARVEAPRRAAPSPRTRRRRAGPPSRPACARSSAPWRAGRSVTLRVGSPLTRDDAVLDDEARPAARRAARRRAAASTARASAAGRAQGGTEHARRHASRRSPCPTGQRSVSPRTMSIDSRATPSSSATICASEVMTPCPISILPEKTVTRPSSPIRR